MTITPAPTSAGENNPPNVTTAVAPAAIKQTTATAMSTDKGDSSTTTTTTTTATTTTSAPHATDKVGTAVYFTTQTSPSFLTAKSLLANNDMDSCLTLVMSLLASTRAECKDDDLSPSLGPLYYLYGTALLYTVEDKTDEVAAMSPDDQEEVRGHTPLRTTQAS